MNHRYRDFFWVCVGLWISAAFFVGAAWTEDAFGCGALDGNCVPKCGAGDAECPNDPATTGEACSYYRANPHKEHIGWVFGQVAHCWGVGGREVGGIGPDKCRGDGWAHITLKSYDHEFWGHAAASCAKASGIPRRVLSRSTQSREWYPFNCPDYHSWSVWPQSHPPSDLKGIAGVSDAVPSQCSNFDQGPG